ncbi:MAG: AEC family transporter [Cellulosilyticaceae bacterium]
MENLIFSLNATIPIFLMMVVGYFLRRWGMFDEVFADKVNAFVFKVALPVLVFKELATANFYELWDTKFVVFCFVASLLSILLSVGVAKLMKNKAIQAEFAQAAYRSSAALLGCAFVENIYGKAGPASLMIIGSVPLYNVAAVIILNRMKPEGGELTPKVMKDTLIQVVTNPIILGIGIGFLWSVLRLPQPEIMQKTVGNIANLATPLGLMALGSTFDFSKTKESVGPSVVCSVFKLLVFVVIFIPIAVSLGFREDKLVALLVLLGGATTISSFVMARNLGHEGTLTSSVVALTTLGSAFTLSGALFVLRSLGWI